MIDGHCHLDLSFACVKTALNELHQSAKTAGITKVILLNIPGPQFGGQVGFDNDDVLHETKSFENFFEVFVAIDPFSNGTLRALEAYKAQGAKGLKLHPRIHNYQIESPKVISLVQRAGELNLPVMICGFQDGINLMLKNDPPAFGRLAQAAPQTKIAIGHAGGQKILDALMVAKYCKNLYLDLSFTLLYFRNSLVPKDIRFAIQSIGAKRIFFGTDYPDRPYQATITASLAQLDQFDLSNEQKEAILIQNTLSFLAP